MSLGRRQVERVEWSGVELPCRPAGGAWNLYSVLITLALMMLIMLLGDYHLRRLLLPSSCSCSGSCCCCHGCSSRTCRIVNIDVPGVEASERLPAVPQSVAVIAICCHCCSNLSWISIKQGKRTNLRSDFQRIRNRNAVNQRQRQKHTKPQ